MSKNWNHIQLFSCSRAKFNLALVLSEFKHIELELECLGKNENQQTAIQHLLDDVAGDVGTLVNSVVILTDVDSVVIASGVVISVDVAVVLVVVVLVVVVVDVVVVVVDVAAVV